MGRPPRKKLEKTVAKQAQPAATYLCQRCGKTYNHREGNFSVSHSPMYRATGYMPICYTCVDDMFEYYKTGLGSERAAMRRMCMKLDLYWTDKVYDIVERTAGIKSRVRSYVARVNLIKFVDKTFDDTLKDEEEAQKLLETGENTSDSEKDSAEGNKEISRSVINFWGAGYPDDMYVELERHYKDWTKNTKVTEPSVRSLYRQICLLEVMIARDSAQGKSIDKNVNALNSLLGSMNLKPSQMKEDISADLEKMPLGVGIQKWENERPLPPVPKELKDVNETVKYITTWYLGHACKMVGLKNGYVKMYEDAMNELRVKHPEYEDEDDDTLLDDLFGDSSS